MGNSQLFRADGSLLYVCKGSTMQLLDFDLDGAKAGQLSNTTVIGAADIYEPISPNSILTRDTTRSTLRDLFVDNSFLQCTSGE